jgi:hypothetical protein
MIEKTGIVENLDGEYAVVRAEDVQTHDNFITNLYRFQTRMQDDGFVTFHALNRIGARPGDRVRFSLPVKRFFDSSYIEYLFFFFVILTALAFDLTIIVFAVVAIILYKLKPKDDDDKPINEPNIVEIVDNPIQHQHTE